MRKTRIVAVALAATMLTTGIAASSAAADAPEAPKPAAVSPIAAGQAFASLIETNPKAVDDEVTTRAFPLAVTLVASRVAVGVTGRAGVKAAAKQFAKNVGQTGAGSAAMGG
ncbi:hypothetical protein AB0P36_05760 [Streptomyces flavidovirens]|uniref:hypothetical protein n=1 Tax=Streptomyces flavidovirens TaxID=67298 RepID=UPI0034208354